MKILALNRPLAMGRQTKQARIADEVTIGMGRGAGSVSDCLVGGTVLCARQPKLWIAAALSTAAGLATSLIGGASASSAQREAMKRVHSMEAKENASYNRRYNEDYVDTAAGQNLVRRAKEMRDEQIRRAEGAKAVAGGTEAAVAQAKDAGNKMVGDTLANIAASDQARKSNLDATHAHAERQFGQMEMANEQQRAQNISNAAAAASNAIMGIGSAVEQANANKVNLQGGSNNGAPVSGVTRNAGLSADGGSVNLKSNVAGIGGETDLDWLRRQIGVA